MTFVEDADNPQAWQDAVKPNTKAFFGETFANPQADVLDIPAVAELAHKNNVPLIVDNTIATAALVRPLDLGADIVVASLTKFYTGNGSGLGGILIDGGSFDWTVEKDGNRSSGLRDPGPRLPRPEVRRPGRSAFGLRARVGLLRDTGATLSTFNAWVTIRS